VSAGAGEGVAEGLAAAARERPDKVALALPRGWVHRPGRAGFATTTFAELDRRADAVAAGLRARGVSGGARAALLVPPGAAFFALAFGLLRAGAVPVLVDPGIGRRHLRACLGEAEPSAFLGVPRAHAARRVLGWCPTATTSVSVGPALPGAVSLQAVERDGRSRLPAASTPVPAGETAAIAFTSGSTGVPKGVEYRPEQLKAQVGLLRELYDITPGEVSLATFPPFALFGPALGLTTVVPRMDATRPARARPQRVTDAAATFGASLLFASPALVDRLGRWGAASGARLPELRRVISAGAPVAPAVQRRMLAMLPAGAQVHTPYGATEALPVTTIGSDEVLALDRPGICVGRPVPGVDLAVVAIRDEPLYAVEPLPTGEVGEIVVRGPNVTTSYLARPAATVHAKLDWDGRTAHRMGDAGWLDEAGRVWFAGRVAHRVLTADGALFSVPVEAVFDAHPRVRRSALVGAGAPPRQRPVLVVETEPGVCPDAALTAELLALGATDPQAAAVRTIRYFPRALPVDIRHNAKIDRPALAAWASAQGAGAQGVGEQGVRAQVAGVVGSGRPE